ncbi:unnamed protein product [Pylaiella littoralis]
MRRRAAGAGLPEAAEAGVGVGLFAARVGGRGKAVPILRARTRAARFLFVMVAVSTAMCAVSVRPTLECVWTSQVGLEIFCPSFQGLLVGWVFSEISAVA